MKKYFLSHIDFSEIKYVTADEEVIEAAKKRLTSAGILTEKGNPSPSQISGLTDRLVPSFFRKLQKRMDRIPGGVRDVCNTMNRLYERREYTAVFFYLAFLYGFMEWQVPRLVSIMPASAEVLKVFCLDFLTKLSVLANEAEKESEDNEQDDAADL